MELRDGTARRMLPGKTPARRLLPGLSRPLSDSAVHGRGGLLGAVGTTASEGGPEVSRHNASLV